MFLPPPTPTTGATRHFGTLLLVIGCLGLLLMLGAALLAIWGSPETRVQWALTAAIGGFIAGTGLICGAIYRGDL